MKSERMRIVFIGLTVSSSWGNGHATTYRALLRELALRGHDILFLERDVPWYSSNRDMPTLPWCRLVYYSSLDELKQRHAEAVRDADAVIVGSFVPEGIAVGEWVLATARGARIFYDIDTPVTLAAVAAGTCAYLNPQLIPAYDLYLSFTGGPMLRHLEKTLGARSAKPLYCSVDPADYYPESAEKRFDMGYLGTYSDDRQPALDELLMQPARMWNQGKFAVAGSSYPSSIEWPSNVLRIEHLAPPEHRAFYNAQRFTLNITREVMKVAGYSPSVRLFEAAACGIPIISDMWPGLDEFFRPGEEIFIAHSAAESLAILRETPAEVMESVASRARESVLAAHTGAHRAEQLETYVHQTTMQAV